MPKLEQLAAKLAIAFAGVLAIVETVHNWGDWRNPALWIIDYLACLILYVGGYFTLKGHWRGIPLLCAGWGFTCAIFWMAYFIIREDNAINPGTYLPIVENFALGLFITTILGFSAILIAVFRMPKKAA